MNFFLHHFEGINLPISLKEDSLGSLSLVSLFWVSVALLTMQLWICGINFLRFVLILGLFQSICLYSNLPHSLVLDP